MLARFGDMGRSASINLVFGYIARRIASRFQDPQTAVSEVTLSTKTRVPCEVLVSDVLVHKGLGLGSPRVDVLALSGDVDDKELTDSRTTRLAVSESVEDVGPGVVLMGAQDRIPRYADLIQLGLSRLRAKGEDLFAYRCMIEHPIVSSMAVVRLPMPERPEVTR